jgi:histidyl-tRNA synthetase
LLQEKGLLDNQVPRRQLDYFVACADAAFAGSMYGIAAAIRSRGHSAGFSYKLGGLSKQLKQATSQNAAKCIIIGEEFKDGFLAVKDMNSGQQTQVAKDAFLSELGG